MPPQPNIFNRMYSTAEVGAVSGLPVSTINSYRKRGFPLGSSEDQGGGTQGRDRRNTWHTLMEFVVAKQLMQLFKVAPEQAFRDAVAFAHSGGPGVLPGQPAAQREPGLPWHYSWGVTLLVMGPARSAVIAVHPKDPKALSLLNTMKLVGGDGVQAVDVLALYRNLATNIDAANLPLSLLDAAYRASDRAPEDFFS